MKVLPLRIDIHLHVHNITEVKSDTFVVQLLKELTGKVDTMSVELDRLTTEVSETNTVIDSAIALIQGLKTALDAAIVAGPAALTALSNSLDAKQNELAQAVVAGTPVA